MAEASSWLLAGVSGRAAWGAGWGDVWGVATVGAGGDTCCTGAAAAAGAGAGADAAGAAGAEATGAGSAGVVAASARLDPPKTREATEGASGATSTVTRSGPGALASVDNVDARFLSAKG